jgi:hypothetical protein
MCACAARRAAGRQRGKRFALLLLVLEPSDANELLKRAIASFAIKDLLLHGLW